MKKVNQLKVGALLSYISLGLTNIISIIYTPIMLRLLGQSEYGLYTLSNSIIGYLGVLDFGLGNAIVRYTAKYRAEKNSDAESNLNGLFIIVYSIIAMIVSMVGGALILNIDSLFSETLSIEEISRMKILMILMIFNLAISLPGGIFGSIITAYERFIFPKVLGIIRAILNPFIMLPLLLMGYKSVGMTIATTVINIVYIIVNMYYCFHILKIKVRFKRLDFSILKEIIGYSFFVFLGMIVDKIYWSTDQFILGAVQGTTVVAIYAVGSTFNAYYMNFSTAISGVFLPKVTKMVTEKASEKELSDLFIKVGRIQFIVMSFILGGFLLVGKNFINLWAGEGYNDAYYIAIIVMIPLTIPLIQNMGLTILYAKNKQKFRSNVYIAIAILNVMLSIPLGKAFGGIGCALATSFAMLLGNIIIINIYYYKKIHIDIPDFWRNICKMSIPVIISVVIGAMAKYIIITNGLVAVLAVGLIFTVIFIPLMWFMGMNNYEKELFILPIRKIVKKYS
ncbi:oligosaccharide flippase family protein [Clostridium butyricum]|uniref:oligosaccharide flippase family protein n=1 Tax=Clostridium butyricum TaxID=1492 RepID=UPI003D326CBB